MTLVVVLTGKAAGKVGTVIGCDRHQGTSRRARSFVRFVGESFPNDLCSIADDNLRPASDGEALVIDQLAGQQVAPAGRPATAPTNNQRKERSRTVRRTGDAGIGSNGHPIVHARRTLLLRDEARGKRSASRHSP